MRTKCSFNNRLNHRSSVIFTLLLLFSAHLSAYEFKTFKVTAKLFANPQDITPLNKTKARSLFDLVPGQTAYDRELERIKKSTNLPSNPVVPSEQSNLYTRIQNYLMPNYQHIGETQSSSLINYNRSYDLGQQNYSGFTWQKPMANFYIGVDRKVEPDLFDDHRWLVKDKFIISINAFSYLSNLQQEGKIEIDPKQLAAFAGMEFIRVYRYIHFADSFNEGLAKEYNKLFLSFLLFRANKLEQLEEYELVTKEDYLSANAGGLVQVPSIPVTGGVGVTINAGALVEYKKMAQVTIQKLGPLDHPSANEILRVSYEVSKEKTVTTQAVLEADFFHLLRITLLSADLDYSFKDADKIYLTFKQDDLKELMSDSKLGQDFKKLLRLKRPHDLSTLNPYITSRERRLTENRTARYSILLQGAESSDSTEQVIIEHQGEQTIFYKTFVRQLKYVRGIFGTLIDSFFRTVFQTSIFKNFKASRLRKLHIEYKFDPTTMNNEDVIVHQSGDLSFSITNQFTAKKTTGFWNQKYRKYAEQFVNNFTNLDPSYVQAIKNYKMIGPISIKTVFRINKSQIDYLNSLSPQQVAQNIKLICSSVSKRSSKRNRCIKKIWNEYQHYYQTWKPHNDMALNSLRDFIKTLNKYSDSIEDIRYIFGEHTFYSGTFSAKLAQNGKTHITYFKDGTFQGLGVIDNFRRQEVTRAPAAITH